MGTYKYCFRGKIHIWLRFNSVLSDTIRSYCDNWISQSWIVNQKGYEHENMRPFMSQNQENSQEGVINYRCEEVDINLFDSSDPLSFLFLSLWCVRSLSWRIFESCKFSSAIFVCIFSKYKLKQTNPGVVITKTTQMHMRYTGRSFTRSWLLPGARQIPNGIPAAHPNT